MIIYIYIYIYNYIKIPVCKWMATNIGYRLYLTDIQFANHIFMQWASPITKAIKLNAFCIHHGAAYDSIFCLVTGFQD